MSDRAGGRFVRDDLIRDLHHAGEFYEQDGPIDVPPQSTDFPPLMMAAGSLAGLRLAVRGGADYVFGVASTLAAAKRLRRALRAEAAAAGRRPNDVRLILGANLRISGANATLQRVTPTDRALFDLAGNLAHDIPSLRLDGLSPYGPRSRTAIKVVYQTATRPADGVSQAKPGQVFRGNFADVSAELARRSIRIAMKQPSESAGSSSAACKHCNERALSTIRYLGKMVFTQRTSNSRPNARLGDGQLYQCKNVSITLYY